MLPVPAISTIKNNAFRWAFQRWLQLEHSMVTALIGQVL